MALHFPLLVNGQRVGSFHAARTAGMQEHARARYRVTVELGGRLRTCEVDHVPADGAWALIRRALNLLEA